MYVSNRRQFHKYKGADGRNRVLIESGTYLGEGVEDALKCGYERVISFEVEPKLAEAQAKRFAADPRVTIVGASSATHLYSHALKDLKEPATIWLDGHFSGGFTGFDAQHVCPLWSELDQISKFSKETGILLTILIDDRRLFGKQSDCADGMAQISEQKIRDFILSIHPGYKISYDHGHIADDILVAVPWPIFAKDAASVLPVPLLPVR